MVTKLLDYEAARAEARTAVRRALAEHPPFPEEMDALITLGARLVETSWVFELYVPDQRPEDALVLAKAEVHRATGRVSTTVFPERWAEWQAPTSAIPAEALKEPLE